MGNKSLLVTSGPELTVSTATTNYIAIGNAYNRNHATETRRQIKFRAAGVLSKLYIKIESNSRSSTTTLRVRKNTGNGNQVISIGAGVSGHLEDTTNTDTVAVNDLLNYSIVTTGTGTLTFKSISTIFDPTTAGITYTPLVCTNDASATLSSGSATRYQTPVGFFYLTSSSESDMQHECRVAGTLKALSVYIHSNSRTTTTTVRSRKNTANGNLVVSITSGVTGLVEDLTNSDTVAVNDKVCTVITTGTGSQAIQLQLIRIDYETATDTAPVINQSVFGYNQPAAATYYSQIAGGTDYWETESVHQMELQEDFTFSKLALTCTANSLNVTHTLRFRKNTANGNQVISISAGTTGNLRDTTNTDVCVAGDLVDYSLVSGAGTGELDVRSIAMIMNMSASVVNCYVTGKNLANKFIIKV